MDAKQDLTNMLKGFTTHHKSNELLFKNVQKKKTYRGSTYQGWLETRMTYWCRHYNRKYNTHITLSESEIIYDELLKNTVTEPTKLQMKG